MKERAKNLRVLEAAALEARMAELADERFKLRFRNSMQQLENPLLIRTNRRSIARLKTVLAEKQRAAGK